jgi:uncharacterized protein YrrD
MTLLVRAAEVVGRPVVTLAGEDVAQVKDVVYDGSGGAVGGFTLNGRGLFAGPLKVSLPWASVIALGRDAVMIPDEGVFADRDEVVASADFRGGDVLGDRVLTDTGIDLGTVVDVILQVGRAAEAVGYEVAASPALHPDGLRVLIPLPHAVAVSGEALIVPAGALEFVADDLSGFGAAVAAFRARIARGRGGG